MVRIAGKKVYRIEIYSLAKYLVLDFQRSNWNRSPIIELQRSKDKRIKKEETIRVVIYYLQKEGRKAQRKREEYGCV